MKMLIYDDLKKMKKNEKEQKEVNAERLHYEHEFVQDSICNYMDELMINDCDNNDINNDYFM